MKGEKVCECADMANGRIAELLESNSSLDAELAGYQTLCAEYRELITQVGAELQEHADVNRSMMFTRCLDLAERMRDAVDRWNPVNPPAIQQRDELKACLQHIALGTWTKCRPVVGFTRPHSAKEFARQLLDRLRLSEMEGAAK